MKSDEKGFKNPCFGLEIIKRSCVLIELLFLAIGKFQISNILYRKNVPK